MLDKDKINVTLDTLDGDAIADVLKDNSAIKSKVNNWLKKFQLQVNVEEFKEVIHHLKIKQNNLDLDITDVGFGISQLLPVIIQGFLSADDSTTIIEQPEIHLHPKIQAELADLFIDIIKNSGKEKKLIIETHSEYLLKRLRRRISEGKISPNDVSICLFHPHSETKPAYIENLEIAKKGFFEWPLDFYGGELLKDTTEFLKNQ
jgi:predicted ATPase